MPRPAVLLLALVALTAPAASAGAKAVPKGPGGTAFYTLKGKVPARHGTLIRARRQTGAAVPPGGRTDLLLYSVKGVRGKAVATSGTITYPKGKAPKGGWPVITFAHGTTGIADQCAPSRLQGASAAVRAYTTYAFPLFTRWLKAGWAVARTDYEGLGTPGTHPYLIGSSEGRATLDVVTAADQDGNRLDTKRVIISGHSQGGHAALWANALAPRYAARLRIRGTVAFAPESHTGEQAEVIAALTAPSPLSGLAAMILRGAEVQKPALDVASLLGSQAAALYPRVDRQCLQSLVAASSFGGIAPADLIRAGADRKPVIATLSANDSEDLSIRGPLRIEQGAADGTVFPAFTDQTVAAYEAKGRTVDYDKVAGLDHAGIVTEPAVQQAATKWMAERLR